MTGAAGSSGSSASWADSGEQIVHATAVEFRGRAVLLRGRSGSGKSSIALQLMALGGALVSDDRVCLWAQDGVVMARAPDTIKGLIEARGVGILRAEPVAKVPVDLIVDLDMEEVERLPHPREAVILAAKIPLIHRVDAPHFVPSILQILAHGRSA